MTVYQISDETLDALAEKVANDDALIKELISLARVELQSLGEQAGVGAAPAPAFPEISDQLIRSLIGDVLAVTGTATEQSCLGRCLNPVPEVRARLMEILQLAAQEHGAR